MRNRLLAGLGLLAISLGLLGQTKDSLSDARVLVNPAEAKWGPSKSGSESVTLREDPKSGALELFARYPAGHVFPPHWHSAIERLVLIEGRIAMEEAGQKRFLEPGDTLTCLPSRCSA